MAENIKILKIMGEAQIDKRAEIIEEIKNIKGVLDCIFGDFEGEVLLKYAIDEWSSDYDVLVKIMNFLSDNYGLDSEIFDTSTEEPEEEFFVYEKEEEEEHEHENHCDCHNHDKDNHGSACGCDHDHDEKDIKTKIIELGVSVIFLIVGIILNSISATKDFAKYLFVLSYASAGYEILFDGLTKIVKGKIFNENLLMSIASLSAIAVGHTIEAVAIMALFTIGELFEQC